MNKNEKGIIVFFIMLNNYLINPKIYGHKNVTRHWTKSRIMC